MVVGGPMHSRILAFACLLLLLAGAATAQTVYAPFNNPHQQFFDNNGHPLAGGRISTYAAGTLNPLQTYSDINGTPNTNPIVLDSGGFATIYLASASIYKFVVSNSSGIQQWTQDNIQAASGGGGPPGGITSINGDPNAAQRLIQGPNIAISDTGGGGHTISSYSGLPAGVLLADNFPGADICAKAMAAQAALPTQGGVILFSASSYPPCNSPIAITKANITLQGAGMGQIQGLSNGATILNFAAGVSGITVIGAGYVRIRDMTLLSASTVAGSDNGIYMTNGDAPVVENVSVKGFGGIGVWISETTDFWYLRRVWVDHIKGNGFEWSGVSHGGCSDINLGRGIILSATAIGGAYAYSINCGVDNVFEETHASGNAHADYYVNSNYTYFRDIYSEGGGTFTVNAGTIWNRYDFTLFGQPTIINNAPAFANEWHIGGDAGATGILPAQNVLALTTMPGAPHTQLFQWSIDDTYGLQLNDYHNALGGILYFNPGQYTAASQGWTFPQPVRVISPMRLDGYLDFSGQTPANPPAGICRVYDDSATGNMIGKKSDGSACLLSPTGGGVTSINAVSGAFSFTGAVSCTGATCNFTGGGSSAGGASGDLQKNNGTGGFAAAAINDNGTTLTASEPICVGASCPVSCGSATGCSAYIEAATAGTPTAGQSYCRADTTHNVLCSINGGSETAIPLIPASGAANQTVCLLSSNPPILGKCTSVVGAGGACTCVSF